MKDDYRVAVVVVGPTQGHRGMGVAWEGLSVLLLSYSLYFSWSSSRRGGRDLDEAEESVHFREVF